MRDFELVVPADGCTVVDLDVHRIPPYGDEPEHEHHDLRFLFRAQAGQAIAISEESNDLRWFAWAEIPQLDVDESLLRMAGKARAQLAP